MAWWDPRDWPAYAGQALGKAGQATGETGAQLGNALSMQRGSDWREIDPGGNLSAQAGASSGFANTGQANYAQRGRRAGEVANYLNDVMRGRESMSAEQLRQGLAQNVAAQQSMAAGARPGNQAMMARTAAMNAGRLGAGLAGQQAMAGIAERQAAAGQLGNLQTNLRGQDLQAALGGRNQAMQGYGMLEQARTSRYGADMGVPTTGERILGLGGGLLTSKVMGG